MAQHERRKDQDLVAFSAPKALIVASKAEAVRREMTYSGFCRLALAKVLGYSDEDARELALHGSIRNQIAGVVVQKKVVGTYPPNKPRTMELNEPKTKPSKP
jgi:hypothetical protein